MRNFSVKKLFLNLLVLVCLAVAGWNGYSLFVLHSIDAVWGSVIFIASIGVLIWNISVLKSHQYKWVAPSFKLIFFPLVGIIVVLAFAGVQPLADYKDDLVAKIVSIKPTSESPEGTVNAYIKYWNAGRIDKIVSIVTPNLKDYDFRGIAVLIDTKIIDYTIHIESLFGDYCTVSVTGGMSYNLAGVRTTEPYAQTFSLQKQDGKWLISSIW